MSDESSVNNDSLVSLTTASLHAELRRREEDLERPECGSGGGSSHYNLGLHVFALFLILALSTIACSFPIIARRFPKLPIPHRFLFLSRHFGTGVLIATAFVHLLPTAFVSLTDPCLPPFWTDGYPASAGLIAMMAVLAVVGIEMFFATRGAGHIHGAEYGMLNQDNNATEPSSPDHKTQSSDPRPIPKHFRQESLRFFDSPQAASVEHMNGTQLKEYDEAPQISTDLDRGSASDDLNGSPAIRNAWQEPRERRSSSEDSNTVNDVEAGADSKDNPSDVHERGASSNSLTAQKQREEQKMLLQCLLLEAGILFHSIFIGMALSVATGTPFVVLLVAISFHQTFEGLALGSRIAAITSLSGTRSTIMALAYGTTTPFGQAIGLGVHNLYDPESQTGLLMVGIMNAISSGLLLFAGLVELLAEDFLSDKSYETLYGKKRLQACSAVVAGSLLMALVGAWA